MVNVSRVSLPHRATLSLTWLERSASASSLLSSRALWRGGTTYHKLKRARLRISFSKVVWLAQSQHAVLVSALCADYSMSDYERVVQVHSSLHATTRYAICTPLLPLRTSPPVRVLGCGVGDEAHSYSSTIPADAHRLSGVSGWAVAAAWLADRSTEVGPIGLDRWCAWLSPNVGRASVAAG